MFCLHLYRNSLLTKVVIKEIVLNGLDTGEDLLVSFHSVDEVGNVKALIAATDKAESPYRWNDLLIETTETEFVCVVHSTASSSAIASGELLVDTSLFTQTVSCELASDLASFSTPTIELSVECIPSLSITFKSGHIVLSDARVSCIDEGSSFLIRLDLIDRFRVIASKSSGPIRAVQLMSVYHVLEGPLAPVEIQRYLSRKDLEKLKVEIKLVEMRGNDTFQVKPIDSIPLRFLRINDPKPVGSSGEGQIVLMHTSGGSFVRELNLNDVIRLQTKREFLAARAQNIRTIITGLDPALAGGSIECVWSGIGFDPFISPSERILVPLTGDPSLEFSMKIRTAKEEVAMSSLIVRDANSELRGLYSVPLLRSDLIFPKETVSISVFPTEEQESLLLPKTVHPWPKTDIPDYSAVRLTMIVEKAVRLPAELESGFVVVRTVALTVPPVLLSVFEVLSLQTQNENEVDPWDKLNSALTVTRERTRHPVWEEKLSIDTFQFCPSDWLYFMIYDNREVEGSIRSVPVAHACMPVCRVAEGSVELPLFSGADRSRIPSSYLNISFPFNLIPWTTLFVTQPEDQRIPFEGELCLRLEIYANKTQSEPVKQAHQWLPISPVYPLILHSCPPSGVVRMSLTSLSGKVLAESKHRFSQSDNDGMTCGGIRFFFSRNQKSRYYLISA